MAFSVVALRPVPFIVYFFLLGQIALAQPITGIWKGKMGSSKVELKLVRRGDSLTGTSYYYNARNDYRRYSVKGYFDNRNLEVVWWDDVLLKDHRSGRLAGARGGDALLAVADFNCPGEGIMKLDGNSSLRDEKDKSKKELHLVKGPDASLFPDEWDFVLHNYAYSVGSPGFIDSVERIARMPVPGRDEQEPPMVTALNTPDPVVRVETNPAVRQPEETNRAVAKQPIAAPAPTQTDTQGDVVVRRNKPVAVPAPAQTNEQRFTERKKILQTVIPLSGDSIELRFYDNAEIDGDSTAVFLNGRMLREHILLSDQAYRFKIPVNDLLADNELVMVAENLGSIPPNTSLMVAIVGDKQYEAHLQSTEGSSALVRLVKPDR